MLWPAAGRCAPDVWVKMPDDPARALRALLPLGVAVAAVRIGTAPPALLDEWIEAVPKRRDEFAAGRHAARICLAELGHAPVAIPMQADRRPLWPPGVLGSISHAGPFAMAAVARQGDLATLGIDIEPAEAVARELWPIICRPAEIEWLTALPEAEQARAATALFCAKEAAYKAQYPSSLELFGFDRLETRFAGGDFTARFTADTGPFRAGQALTGRIAHAGGMVIAAVAGPQVEKIA